MPPQPPLGRRRLLRVALALVLALAVSASAAPPEAEAARRPAVGTQFHCMWTHYTNAKRRAVLTKLARAGIRWVRIDVGWWGAEAQRGRFTRSYLRTLDTCVRGARRRGMRVLATFWGSPGWANGGHGHFTPPHNPADYARAAHRMAARYRGRIAAWEIWNEPDPYMPFFAGSTAHYVALLRAAYPAIKSASPNAKVVVGGPSSNDAAWLRQLYLLGAKGSFDVMATHPYQGVADAPPERRDDGNRWWLSHTGAVHRVMRQWGDGHKKIWFTEFGWSTHRDWRGVPNWRRGVTRAQQGRYFVRAVKYTARRFPYVGVMFWYKERAHPQGTDAHLEGFALMDARGRPKPALRAVRAYLRG
jgi:hypothetical protein